MKAESVIIVGVLVIGGLVLLGRREERLPRPNGVVPVPKLIEPRQPTALPTIDIDVAAKVKEREAPQPVRQPVMGIPGAFPLVRRRRDAALPIQERHRGLRPRPPIPPRRRPGGGTGAVHYAFH